MTVSFYDVHDDPKVLNKELGTALLTLNNVKLKGEVDEFNPTLELANNVNLESANYFYIHDWGKYYYKIPNETNNLGFIVRGEEDVRMTWKEQILNQYGIVGRQEMPSDKNGNQMYNCYIGDERIMQENRSLVTCINFPYGLPEQDTWLLVVNGR